MTRLGIQKKKDFYFGFLSSSLPLYLHRKNLSKTIEQAQTSTMKTIMIMVRQKLNGFNISYPSKKQQTQMLHKIRRSPLRSASSLLKIKSLPRLITDNLIETILQGYFLINNPTSVTIREY